MLSPSPRFLTDVDWILWSVGKEWILAIRRIALNTVAVDM